MDVEAITLDSLLEAICRTALMPVFDEVSNEVGQPMEFSAVLSCAGFVARRDYKSPVGGPTLSAGEVRIVLRNLELPSRFSSQAIFKDLAPGTGFSGFELRGRIKVVDQRLVANLTSQSNCYNLWDWSPTFLDHA